MKKIFVIIVMILLLVGISWTPMQVNALTTSWVGSNTYGLLADHSAALDEVKNLMKQQTSAYKMERFQLILSEFPLSGYFNKSKTSPCSWHCASCEKRDASCCINSFYDSEIKQTVELKAWQCYGYARYCTYRFFGSTLISQGVSVSSTHTSSVDNFKKFLSQYSDLTGAHFRSNGHSMVYLARDSQYIYFIDANSGYNSNTGASKKCSTNSSHWSTCCKIHLRKMTYSQFINKYSSITLYYSANNSSTDTVTIKNSSTNGTMTVYENNAVLHGSVLKPTSYPITKFGIRIRLTNGTYNEGWSYFHDPKSSYTTKSEVPFWFDIQDELNLTLTHMTSYTYQLYTVVNGKDYWGSESTFTTSGSHAYGTWTTTTAATCTTKGLKRRSCACGAVETNTIPALGHNYSSSFTIDKAATCTTTGSKSKHCTRCTATTEVTSIPATGHSYGAWSTTTAATCTSTGSQKHSCSTCNNIEYKTIAALGHSYSSSWTTDKAASCTVSGTKSHHCTRCSAKSDITTIPSTGHSWTNWTITKQATYDSTGNKVRKCTVNGCSAQETAVIAKIALDGHTHNFGVWITESKATCDKDGVQKRVCSICKVSESQNIAAIGHIFDEWVVKKMATCTEEGLQKRDCSVCRESETLTIKALGHSFSEWQTKVEATADKEGLLECKCTRCESVQKQAIPITTDNSKLNEDSVLTTLPNQKQEEKSSLSWTMMILILGIVAIVSTSLVILVIKLRSKRTI